MYGAQTYQALADRIGRFENDVEMYGAQTFGTSQWKVLRFENDVEMYGAQTSRFCDVDKR